MATDTATKPRILSIALHHQAYYDEIYESLLTAIKSKATFQRAEEAESAIRLLSLQPTAAAVLVADEALTLEPNSHVWEAVLRYVRQGGTAVVMGGFPCWVEPPRIKPFFARAGLEWEAGAYHRTTHVLNREAVDGDVAGKLLPQYSQKALQVKNVALGDAWYVSDENSLTESRVFPSRSAHDLGQSPVTFASVGDGKLAYLGDVNAEKGSDAAILAMCGLA